MAKLPVKDGGDRPAVSAASLLAKVVCLWRGCGQPRAQIQILGEFSGRNTLEGCVGIEK